MPEMRRFKVTFVSYVDLPLGTDPNTIIKEARVLYNCDEPKVQDLTLMARTDALQKIETAVEEIDWGVDPSIHLLKIKSILEPLKL